MGSTQDELVRISKKLEKIAHRKDTSSTAQALDLLRVLQRMPITLDLIQRTRIGLIVNNLRKSIQDEDVGALSKTLIKSWKKLLDQKDSKSAGSENGAEKSSNAMAVDGTNSSESSQSSVTSKTNNNGTSVNNGAGDSKSFSNSVSSSSSSRPAGSSTSNGSSSLATGSSAANNASSSSGSASAERKPFAANPLRQSSFPANTTDSIRLKCREMLANALKPDDALLEMESGGADFYDHVQLGALIEDAIFKEHKDTNMKYKNRIRSRVSNLSDKKNPDLKVNVLRGSIKAEKIAVMTAEEMASAEMKNMRAKFTKEAINDAQMSLTGGTKTDLLKCPACKKNNCTYNQVQTRSADEPMTTFCYCNECGKRWKFC